MQCANISIFKMYSGRNTTLQQLFLGYKISKTKEEPGCSCEMSSLEISLEGSPVKVRPAVTLAPGFGDTRIFVL